MRVDLFRWASFGLETKAFRVVPFVAAGIFVSSNVVAQAVPDSARAAVVALATGKPAFEFRGERFGDAATKKARSCHNDDDLAGGYYCFDFASAEIASVKIKSVTRSYLDEKLYSMDLKFDSEGFERLSSVLEIKYGKPDTTFVQEIQNRMGAKFTNETRRWSFADGRMEIERYSSRVTEGEISAISYAGLFEWDKRRKASAANAALKDLGPPVKK